MEGSKQAQRIDKVWATEGQARHNSRPVGRLGLSITEYYR